MKNLVVALDKSRSNGRPLFIISGLGGHVIPFQIVAKKLSPEWLPFGVLYPGFYDEEPECKTIRDIARRMLRDIQVAQPEGPYFLAGYSMGGVVGVEISKLLAEQGQLASVVLIDAKILQLAPYKPWLRRLPLQVYWTIKHKILFHFFKKSQNVKKIKAGLVSQGAPPPENLTKSLQRVINEGKAALDQYQLTPCDIPTILLKCRDLIWYDSIRTWIEDYGWSRYTRLLGVVLTPGDHMDIFMHPNVEHFSGNLENALGLLRAKLGEQTSEA